MVDGNFRLIRGPPTLSKGEPNSSPGARVNKRSLDDGRAALTDYGRGEYLETDLLELLYSRA